MVTTLSCYYLDQALTDDDLQFVEQALLGPWAKFRTGASALVQKRVPLVLPAPDLSGAYTGTPEQRAARLRSNLLRAGIRSDIGHQVVWLVPRDPEWDALFQFAIRDETGFGPYAVQRWLVESGEAVRAKIRVIDTQMMLKNL